MLSDMVFPDTSSGYREAMTSTLDRPYHAAVHGPAEVRAALVEIGSGIENWDRMLDRVYARAIEEGSLSRVQRFLEDSWASVAKAREVLDGGPGLEQRVTRERFLELAEERNGRPLPNIA